MSFGEVQVALAEQGYVAGDRLAMALHLAGALGAAHANKIGSQDWMKAKILDRVAVITTCGKRWSPESLDVVIGG